jgi:hypothetical protein
LVESHATVIVPLDLKRHGVHRPRKT